VRFHQAVAFLETDQLLELTAATERLGFDGMYVSDHLGYPRDLQSRYTYSPYEDGSPVWAPETDWPDSWCLISAMAAVTERIEFTTGVYIAPCRDLITVAKLVGSAAVISRNRVNLGVGVGWCKEEFELTGQDFHNRGKRLDDMIPALRALWRGGWVEYHGTHYDVPPLQLNPAPSRPVPILLGGDSAPALRRTAALGDGWTVARVEPPDAAMATLERVKGAVRDSGRSLDGFRIFFTVADVPTPDLIRRFEDAGVTDWLCAPWMVAAQGGDGSYRSSVDDKVAAVEQFAEDVVARCR
jgi:probable F420-dependent oxidoreductase